MKSIPVRATIALLLLAAAPTLSAQDSARELRYGDFIKKLAEHNLDYAAQKYNVPIAQAAVQAAKALPDPALSFAAYDNQERRLRLGYGFEAELSWDIELGGKRAARKNLAAAHLALTELELAAYFRQLRAEATLVYLQALQNRMQHQTLLLSLSFLGELQGATGEVIENEQVNASITAVETLLSENRSEWKDLFIALNDYINDGEPDALFIPAGTLEEYAENYAAANLLNHETDTSMAQQKLIVAARRSALAKAERVMDLGVMVGVGNNSFAQNIIGPNPSHTAVKAGISVPIKFSNRFEADTAVAALEKKQAQLEYLAAQRKQQRALSILYREVQATQQQWKEAEKQRVETRKILENAQRDYTSGKKDLKHLLDAEAAYRKSEMDYTATLYEFTASAARASVYQHPETK